MKILCILLLPVFHFCEILQAKVLTVKTRAIYSNYVQFCLRYGGGVIFLFSLRLFLWLNTNVTVYNTMANSYMTHIPGCLITRNSQLFHQTYSKRVRGHNPLCA